MIYILANPDDYNASVVSDLLGYPIVHSEGEIPPNAPKVINFGYTKDEEEKLHWTKKKYFPIINNINLMRMIYNKEQMSNEFSVATGGEAITFVDRVSAEENIRGRHTDGIVCYGPSYKAVAKINTIDEFNKLDHTNITNYSIFIKSKREYQVLFLGGQIMAVIPLVKSKGTPPNPIRTKENGYFYKLGALKIPNLVAAKVKAMLNNINYIVNMNGGVFNILRTQNNAFYLVSIKGYEGVDKSLLPILIKNFAKGIY